jgi:hypothetical protein
VVDDLHWVDPPSPECIRYAAGRACGHLAVVTAARDDAQPSRVDEIAVGPLDDVAAAELLRRHAPGLAPSVATPSCTRPWAIPWPWWNCRRH